MYSATIMLLSKGNGAAHSLCRYSYWLKGPVSNARRPTGLLPVLPRSTSWATSTFSLTLSLRSSGTCRGRTVSSCTISKTLTALLQQRLLLEAGCLAQANDLFTSSLLPFTVGVIIHCHAHCLYAFHTAGSSIYTLLQRPQLQLRRLAFRLFVLLHYH